MRQGVRLKVLGSVMALVGVAAAVMFLRSPGAKAWDDDDEDKLVKIGFEIAPVPLNLQGKNHRLVGLGNVRAVAVFVLADRVGAGNCSENTLRRSPQ